MVESIQEIRDGWAAAGEPERFEQFWGECKAILGDLTVSRHGYQVPLSKMDPAVIQADVTSLISKIESYGVDVCVISGTLLGLIRDGGTIEHDDDIDVAVVLPGDLSQDARAAQWLKIRKQWADDGLIDAEYEVEHKLHARTQTSNGVDIDLFPAWISDGRAFVFPHTFGTVPAEDLLPLTTHDGMPVPARPRALLRSNYGPGWRKPDPLFTFDWEGARATFGAFVGGWRRNRRPKPEVRPRIILHCGALKTGTTAIQNEMWARREELAAAGILYPEAGVVTTEPEIGFRHSRLINAWAEDRAEFDKVLHRLPRQITKSGADTIVLSVESWSRPTFQDRLKTVVDSLRLSVEPRSIEAVIVLRNRQQHARSLYREYTLRRDNNLAPDAFLATRRGWFDPVASLESLAGIVDEVTVLPYAGGDTAQAFFDHIGSGLTVHPDRANVSVDSVDIAARRYVNHLAPDAQHLWPGLSDDDRASLLGAFSSAPTEFLDPAPYQVDPAWRERFVELSGWDEADVDALVAWTAPDAPNIAAIEGDLEKVVRAWAVATLEPTLLITTLPESPLRFRAPRALEREDDTKLKVRAKGKRKGQKLVAVMADGSEVPIRMEHKGKKKHRLRAKLPLGFQHADLVLVSQADGARLPIGAIRRIWHRPEGSEADTRHIERMDEDS